LHGSPSGRGGARRPAPERGRPVATGPSADLSRLAPPASRSPATTPRERTRRPRRARGGEPGPALAYGDDPWSGRLTERFRDLLGDPSTCSRVGGVREPTSSPGERARPWQAVVTSEEAHVHVDECGALTRFAGVPLLTVAPRHGKLPVEEIGRWDPWRGSEHHPQPGAVSVAQATEAATVYRAEELAALADAAHRRGMALHVDGARIANALVAEGVDLRTMVRDTGVDVLSFGATKNGAVYGEAVVLLRPERAPGARFVRKQAAQLPSKARFVAAQMLALLDADLWLDNARHANSMARLLAELVGGIEGVELERPPEANAVFARIPKEAVSPLREWSFFWEWDPSVPRVRWMTSFQTLPDDVEAFAAGVAAAVGASPGR